MKVLVYILFWAGTWREVTTGVEASTFQDPKEVLTNLDSNVENACAEFDNNIPLESGWLYSDCVAVWNGWAATLEEQQLMPWTYRMTFVELSAELRHRGNPCLVESVNYPDGAGSSAIRNLATWMFAEEMGCDWVLPGSYSANRTVNSDGSSLYCHKMMTRGRMHPFQDRDSKYNRYWRCEVTNWLKFFHYNAHAARSTFGGSIQRVKVRSFDN